MSRETPVEVSVTTQFNAGGCHEISPELEDKLRDEPELAKKVYVRTINVFLLQPLFIVVFMSHYSFFWQKFTPPKPREREGSLVAIQSVRSAGNSSYLVNL